MRAFCDISLLLAVALKDAHERKALAALHYFRDSVVIPALVAFEAENRLRFLRLTDALSPDDAAQTRRKLAALVNGPVRPVPLARTTLLLAEGRRLLAHHSPDTPHGSLDTLHVATAALARATAFLTFDKNQRELAACFGAP
ncbi:MAG: PIN domain-containing protein [Verrucomicrobiales bacterium]